MRKELFSNNVQQNTSNTSNKYYGQQQALFVEPQQLQQQQQQQDEVLLNTNTNDDEYVLAQRAATEAVLIGRETLQVAVQQGEQLDHAESIADDTQYTLDKAGRILRGMTWSGWLANKFTRDISAVTDNNNNKQQKQRNNDKEQKRHVQQRQPPLVYNQDMLPVETRDVTQALQNYHANINVLEFCETQEQIATCRIICDKMYQIAYNEIQKLQQSYPSMESYVLEFALDFKTLRERQLASQQKHGYSTIDNTSCSLSSSDSSPGMYQYQQQQQQQTTNDIVGTNIGTRQPPKSISSPSKSLLFDETKEQQQQNQQQTQKVSTIRSHGVKDTTQQALLQQQDNHLSIMAQSLGELNLIANSLSIELQDHNKTIQKLDEKGDVILDKTRMVSRRTDRLIQKSSWMTAKIIYTCNVSIQNSNTGMYLSIDPTCKSNLMLLHKFHPNLSSFAIYKRQNGSIVGIKSNDTSKWIGQSLFGNLTCTSIKFDRREEIELDVSGTPIQDISTEQCKDNVRILLSSAGWGYGAYLIVDPTTLTIKIGSSSSSSSTISTVPGQNNMNNKNTDRWCIKNLNYNTE